MRYRNLGRWGVRVSEIALGSWLTFGGSVDEDVAVACVLHAFEDGVNFFDTANVYAGGRAEEVVGRALRGLPREEYVLATKVFFPMGEGPNAGGLSRKHVVEQCHSSLHRLGVEYVDLYQCHRFDQSTPLEETCRAMDDLIRGGEVLYWGVSEWTPDQMTDAVGICERERLHPPVSDQPHYSLLERAIEDDVLQACRELGLGAVVFSPLGRAYSPASIGASMRRRRVPVRRIRREPASSAGSSPRRTSHASNGFGRSRMGGVHAGAASARVGAAAKRGLSVIVGATNLRQLGENIAASGVTLDDDVVERIEAAVA